MSSYHLSALGYNSLRSSRCFSPTTGFAVARLIPEPTYQMMLRLLPYSALTTSSTRRAKIDLSAWMWLESPYAAPPRK